MLLQYGWILCLAISILILMICTAAMQRSYEAYELLKKDSKDKVNILKHEGSDHIFTTIKTVFSPYLISKLLILCRSSLTHTSDAWKIPLCSCQHSLVCQEEASPLFPQKWAILVSPPFFYLPLLSYLVIRGKVFLRLVHAWLFKWLFTFGHPWKSTFGVFMAPFLGVPCE